MSRARRKDPTCMHCGHSDRRLYATADRFCTHGRVNQTWTARTRAAYRKARRAGEAV